MPLFSAILLWPLLEIVLFVAIGGQIGVLATLLIVLGTGFLGVSMLKGGGMVSRDRLRREMSRLGDPLAMAGDDVLRSVAAILLILPGFLTDAFGLMLLLPPVRRLVIARLSRRFVASRPQDGGPQASRVIIDAEYFEVGKDTPRGTSGWTRD